MSIPEQAEIPPPYVEEVSEGLYAYVQLDGSWWLNNAGLLVGRDGVTVIDTCATERRTRALLEAVRSVTSARVRTLVNTHHHGDHSHGNYLLPAATIIGHELCRSSMIEWGVLRASPLFPTVEWGALELAPPFVTFEERLTLWVDDLRVELAHLGPAHTTNDVIAWVPDRRLLFSGDIVFNGGTPFVVMGSVSGALRALEQLRRLGPDKIVPGHGAVSGPEAIDEVEAYLRFVEEVARAGVSEGKSPLEAARSADLGRFAALHDSERLAGNLHRAYSELRGDPEGAPLDYAAVFGDMIAYNGGNLPRCLA